MEETSKSRNLGFLQSLWAYALMGWLIGTFPLMLMFELGTDNRENVDELSRNAYRIIIGMCSVFGAAIGLIIGLLMTLARQKDRILPMILAPFFGIMWGIVVGGIGGFPLFFIGGIILGWIIAVPLGFIGFALFGIIYESLAARRSVRWWEIIPIEIGVLSLSLVGIFAWMKISYPQL